MRYGFNNFNYFPHSQLTKFSAVSLIQKSNRDKNGRYNQMNKLTPFGHCRCRDATILQSDFNITNTAILNVHSAPEPPKISPDLLELLKWPLAFLGGGGATAPFAVYYSYTTGFTSRVSDKIQILSSSPPPPSSSDLFLVTSI